MDDRNIKVLKKIDEHAAKAIRYASKYTDSESFTADEEAVDACVFNIMQIGELAKQALSDDIKIRIHLPWNQIYGLRNRIVHGYSGINMSIVYDVIKIDLPEVRNKIAEYLVGLN